MRFLMSFTLSFILVAACVWLFHQLYDIPISSQVYADEPDISFIDKQDLVQNKACQKANKEFSDYINQPATACQSDQDCTFYDLGVCPGHGLAVNQTGLNKLNHLNQEIDQHCIYRVQVMAMCLITIFHGHEAICQNQQCTILPQVHKDVLKKHIHDFNRLLKQ